MDLLSLKAGAIIDILGTRGDNTSSIVIDIAVLSQIFSESHCGKYSKQKVRCKKYQGKNEDNICKKNSHSF